MAGTLAVLLAGLTVLMGSAPAAEAAVATGGAGRFLEAIDWVTWGSNNQNLPNGGFTGTSSRVVGGQPLVVTCTTSRITSTQPGQASPFLQAYRPGNWPGDALDEMYNVGGTGASNTLVNALSNWAQGALVEFDFSCSATLSGTPVPLAGLVVADAEQSAGGEYVTATPTGNATWRIIDRYRTPGCTASTVATRSATNVLTLAGSTTLCGSGPAAVAFMEGSTSARVGLRGGGKSAVALGVVLAADHGDAPASYGDAAHLGSFGFNGGTLVAGVPTLVSNDAFTLGTAGPPAIRMGTNLDPETDPSTSPDSTGDDTSGNGVFGPADDEDGLRSGTSVTGAVGSSWSSTVACGPAGGSVAGWVDWDVDGNFSDPGERSATSTCAGGTATVIWPSIPDSVVGQPVGASTFMRLRLAQDPADIAGPTSLARSGEVEDYRVTLDLGPTIQVTKDLRSRAYPGDQFAVGVSVGPLTVASATTSGTASGVSTRQVIAAPGISYTVSERLAAGPGTLADYQTPRIVCSNTVTGAAVPVTGSAPGWTLPPAGLRDRYACTITNEALEPAIALTKSVSEVVDLDDDGPDAGDQVSYSFLVTNTGDATLSGVEVVEGEFSGTGTAPVATCPGAPVSLAPGSQVVCTASYTLTQADVDAGEVTNTATATGTPPGTLPAVESAPDDAVVVIDREAGLSVVKSADSIDQDDYVVGREVSYSFVLTNTGNVTLTDVAPAEVAFSGSGEMSAISCPEGADVLAPGAQVTCTATYTLTQADIDAEQVSNTVTAEGTPPTGVEPPEPTPSTAVVPTPDDPEVTLTKTVSPAVGLAAGDEVTYSFLVTNTGNVSLTDAAVVEGAFSGTGPLGAVSCPAAAASLLPGAQVTCTATYTVTQADVDAGQVTNTATATATAPGGEEVVSEEDDAVLLLPADPAITLVKTVGPTAATTAGDEVMYSFAVTNTGNVTLHNVTVVETEFSGTGTFLPPECPVDWSGSLAPDESVTCFAPYTLTQADVDAGEVTNTATATGTPPGSSTPAPVSEPDDAVVTVAPAPGVALVKTADPAEVGAAGDEVTYSFSITNTGNVTLANVTANEVDFSGTGVLPLVTCPPGAGSLAPGAEVTCTAVYELTQADVDAGQVTNTATATGTPPGDATPPVSEVDDATVLVDRDPSLTLVKTASPAAPESFVVGQEVAYTFLVTNDGDVTLDDVAVQELEFTGSGTRPVVVCPEQTTLAPGNQLTCTASYTVTQADVDAGQVSNTAVATATPPGGLPAVESEPDDARVPAESDPGLSLDKTVSPTEGTAAGDVVTYSFLVTNTGNLTLTGVAVEETAFTGTGPAPVVSCPAEAATLAPGAQVTCTASYTLTQADVDAGEVDNTAVATAAAPGGLPEQQSEPDEATVVIAADPGLSLVKTVDPGQVSGAGDQVTYSFLVTNTGNVTLTDVAVDETRFTGSGTAPLVVCPVAAETLAPGAEVTCTATYTLTQADVDAGEVENTATATGTPPSGPATVSEPDDAVVTVPPAPGLSLAKSAALDPADGFVAGAEVTYSFLVTNTGNVTVEDVVVLEREFSGTGELSEITCPEAAGSMAPGDQVTCTASYTLTQADVDAGEVTNTAAAEGTPPGDLPPVVSEPDDASVPLPAGPSISLVKSATPEVVGAAGQEVTYTFVVTNTGNVTLDDVAPVEGDFSGTGELSDISCPVDRSLAPQESLTCTATYPATQADVDAGEIQNTATATGTPPQGLPPVGSEPDDAVVRFAAEPGLSLEKTVSPTEGTGAGDVVTYSFLVTNTGNLTLTEVAVEETAFTGTGPAPVVACPAEAATLAPGAQVTCTASYTLTQADVDAGEVDNTAVATATAPRGLPPQVSDPDEATVVIAADPGLSLVKTVDPGQVSGAGDQVTYSFLVTNTGNVTLSDVGVDETAFTGTGTAPVVVCPAAADTMAPGAEVTCTATYTLTQADVDAGEVENTATATGTPPSGPATVSGPDDAVVTVPPAPALSLVKSAEEAPEGGFEVGEEVTYSFVVTNTGNVTLDDVAVEEREFSGSGKLGEVVCPDGAASLAPGAQVTCTASYTLTQADVDAGEVTNTAAAVGTPPGDLPPVTSEPDDAVLPTPADPSLSLVKDVAPEVVGAAGDEVTYSFLITNTGNVTLSDVSPVEGEFSGTGELSQISCPEGAASLLPGQQVTCTARYTLTQADVDAQTVTNTATAQGTPPRDLPAVVSEPDDAVLAVEASSSLSLVKSASPSSPEGFVVGQQITYTFVATNTGTSTLRDPAVSETSFDGSGELSALSCPVVDSLAPGATLTCTADYVLTQADVDAGSVSNSAVVSGNGPDGPVTSPPSTVTLPGEPEPAVTLEKSVTPTVYSAAGEVLTYTFEITNTGDVTLTDPRVEEQEFSGTGELDDVRCPSGPVAPGERVSCTATYEVTQADVDAGSVTNVATATGTAPAGLPAPVSEPDDAVATTDAVPALALQKRARAVDTDGDGLVGVGDAIEWTLTVQNPGATTVTGIEVLDPTAGTVTCPVDELGPGESMTCTVPRHVVTEADVERGEVSNTATASGSGVGGAVAAAPATASIQVQAVPAPPGEEAPPATTPPPAAPPVDGGPGPLPDTGGPLVGLLLLGVLGSALGIGLVRAGNRRR